jgi:hypothetical protein
LNLSRKFFSNEEITTSSTNEEEYVKKRTSDFQRLFNNPNPQNENINPIFYNKKAYDEYMNQEKETKLEQLWKKRILLEYTPRGNVSMYYDPYKMGFKYHSDQKTISYELLNTCAMKYVKFFQCRDFFMDESHLPVNNPLIELHYGIDTPTTTKNTKNTSIAAGPFIKRQQQQTKSQKQKEQAPEKMKNKFLYVGKFSNTTFLIIPQKNMKTLPVFRSSLLDSLEQNADVQQQRFSYKDFKHLSSSSSS